MLNLQCVTLNDAFLVEPKIFENETFFKYEKIICENWKIYGNWFA